MWRDRLLIGGAATYSIGWGAVCLLLLLGVFFWERRQAEPGWQHSALDRPMAIFLVVVVISSLWSEWRWQALAGTAQLGLVGFIVLRAVVLAFTRDQTLAPRLISAWAAGGAVVGVIGLITTLLGIGMPDGRLQLTIGSNSLGSVFAIAAVLLLVAFVKESGRRRWFACAGVAAVAVALALTQSRGGWLGAAIGVAALSALVPPRRFLICLCGAAVALAAASPLITAGLGAQTARLSGTLSVEDIRSRPAIWRTVPRILRGHLVLGIGLTTFPLAYRRVVPEAVAQDLSPHAHNVFLSVLAETGIAGLAAFLVVIAAIIGAMWRWHTAAPPQDPDRLISAAVLAAFAALLGHHLVDMTLFGTHIAVGFMFLVGLGVAGDLRRRPVW